MLLVTAVLCPKLFNTISVSVHSTRQNHPKTSRAVHIGMPVLLTVTLIVTNSTVFLTVHKLIVRTNSETVLTSLDYSFSYLFFNPAPSARFVVVVFVLFVFCCHFGLLFALLPLTF